MEEKGGRWNGCVDQLDKRGLSLFNSLLGEAVSVQVEELWVLVEKRREKRESSRGADAKARAEYIISTRTSE
jgi:hypothetical protein